MLIALLTVLLNVVNTSGEYLFGRYVVEQSQALHGAGPEAAAAARARSSARPTAGCSAR